MHNREYLVLSFLFMFFSGCLVTPTGVPKNEKPLWVAKMPEEDDYYFGLGLDQDLSKAKQKSIVDVGMQFGTKVESVLTDQLIIEDSTTKNIITRINRQITDQIVYGAKIIDQYQDPKGNYWILTRAPVNCMLDLTEGLLLSYSVELQQNQERLEDLIKEIEYVLDDQMYTLKVIIDLSDRFGGMNAGANAVDKADLNRAVSEWLYLDSSGNMEKILAMDGIQRVFKNGEILNVYCNVWVGSQARNDYRYTAIKKIKIMGDTVITFTDRDNSIKY